MVEFLSIKVIPTQSTSSTVISPAINQIPYVIWVRNVPKNTPKIPDGLAVLSENNNASVPYSAITANHTEKSGAHKKPAIQPNRKNRVNRLGAK